MAAQARAANAAGSATVNVYDGTRNPFWDSSDILITVRDGNQCVVSRAFHKTATIAFRDLPVFDNFGDDYTFMAAADGYKDAGIASVRIRPGAVQSVDLLLLPRWNEFGFAAAHWNLLRTARPKLAGLLAQGAGGDDAARDRYRDLEDREGGAVLACLLNLTTAMDQIQLQSGTVLDYFKEISWQAGGSFALTQDRLCGWVDPAMIRQIEQAQLEQKFADVPFLLNPGATRAKREVGCGEANIQVTFYEGRRRVVGGVNCVQAAAGMHYDRDPRFHFLTDVTANPAGSLVDPRTVYALRWMSGRRAGGADFDPLYTISRA